MLQRLREIQSWNIGVKDGEIGEVYDFIFDEREWGIRYLVVDTGKWLPGRKVLVSPASIVSADRENNTLNLDLTKEKLKEGPAFDKALPLSGREEEEMVFYYSWPAYWGPPGQFGRPVMVSPTKVEEEARPMQQEAPTPEALPPREEGPHLRSVDEIMGYGILAKGGDIGHVEDFLADDGEWRIRYLVVDTRNWLPGKKVLIAPDWIRAFIWEDSKVDVDLEREEIKEAPEFDPPGTIDREYETELYGHYGRRKYWE
jgi:hypothetical protein